MIYHPVIFTTGIPPGQQRLGNSLKTAAHLLTKTFRRNRPIVFSLMIITHRLPKISIRRHTFPVKTSEYQLVYMTAISKRSCKTGISGMLDSKRLKHSINDVSSMKNKKIVVLWRYSEAQTDESA